MAGIGGSLWGTSLSKGLSFSVSELASIVKGRWPGPALSVTVKRPCWVWVKRIGEQTCFSDLKHLAEQPWLRHLFGRAPPPHWQPLPYSWLPCRLSGQGRGSSPSDSPAIPSYSVHKPNCKQLNVFQAATPSYEGRNQWSEQPPSPRRFRTAGVSGGGFPNSCGSTGRHHNSTTRSSSAAASAGPQGDWQDRPPGITANSDCRQLGRVFKEFYLSGDGPGGRWRAPLGALFSCHSALAHAVISQENVCNQRERHPHCGRWKAEWRSGRSTGSGSDLDSFSGSILDHCLSCTIM